ncbi:GntR family transcriptional regulator [Sulfitobacter sp. S0837]|uniref:GntR family transcriptional regulator n=1 Tax=Sulfitobacter maritimus TaxID=2741719 RepID=UPI001583DD74|nr:GntR family transcriptional regulator [Sulfitobacter maritimus]NUH64803.1 GntR family transcriptional regulator [Sulfitobacter maritimus]
MLKGSQSSQHIAEALRADICLAQSSDDQMLHEGALAQRFGVSRTPVRQALQRLSYERMITVKSGIGSVISPLEDPQRDDDLRAAVAVIKAVAACASDAPASAAQVMDFAGMLGLLAVSDLGRAEDFFQLRARLAASLSALIENPILKDAFHAAYWRLIRWRIQDLRSNPAAQAALLDRLVNTIIQTLQQDTVAATFEKVAALEGHPPD